MTVGGEDDKVVLRSVESFDPITSQWKSLACLPFAVSKHGLVVSGENLVMCFLVFSFNSGHCVALQSKLFMFCTSMISSCSLSTRTL